MSEALHCPVYDMADVISMKIYKKASSLDLFFLKNALKSEFIHV